MDLVKQYLDQAHQVEGIYVIHFDPEKVTVELLDHIGKEWEMVRPEFDLILLPSGLNISYQHKYSFYIAMMLLKQGRKITRRQWRIENEYDDEKTPYLELADIEGDRMIVLSKKNQEDFEVFLVFEEDMEADDYQLFE